jgi:hypothetical protein
MESLARRLILRGLWGIRRKRGLRRRNSRRRGLRRRRGCRGGGGGEYQEVEEEEEGGADVGVAVWIGGEREHGDAEA